MDAMEQNKLARIGLDTRGTVESHRQSRRGSSDRFEAIIRYDANGRTRLILVSGIGATVKRLPVGSAVTVRYLPYDPSRAKVELDDASSGGWPGWIGVLTLWGLTLVGMIGAYLTRSRKRLGRRLDKPR
nr:DUF3592 domain-containing protein [Mitsuaria sp. 7]